MSNPSWEQRQRFGLCSKTHILYTHILKVMPTYESVSANRVLPAFDVAPFDFDWLFRLTSASA